MNRLFPLLLALPLLLGAEGGDGCADNSQRASEKAVVDRQQSIYLTAQPVPTFDYSLERDRVTGLYRARMNAAQTWSVWRSTTGVVEGDCPSSGYPLPYGVQLTSPEVIAWSSSQGGAGIVPQAEPNGLFTNGVTSTATWVFCVTDGAITPVYVESVVTVYPYPVEVDPQTGRVTAAGAATVKLEK